MSMSSNHADLMGFYIKKLVGYKQSVCLSHIHGVEASGADWISWYGETEHEFV